MVFTFTIYLSHQRMSWLIVRLLCHKYTCIMLLANWLSHLMTLPLFHPLRIKSQLHPCTKRIWLSRGQPCKRNLFFCLSSARTTTKDITAMVSTSLRNNQYTLTHKCKRQIAVLIQWTVCVTTSLVQLAVPANTDNFYICVVSQTLGHSVFKPLFWCYNIWPNSVSML